MGINDENEYEIVIPSPRPSTTEVTYPNPPVESLYGESRPNPTVSLEKNQTQTQQENITYNDIYHTSTINQYNNSQYQQPTTYASPEQVQFYYPPQSVIQIPEQNYQPAPTPTLVYPSVLVTSDEAARKRREWRDLCFALGFFALGFFFWFPWIFGACFLRSKSKPAKTLGVMSIFLACVSLIFGVIFVSVNGSPTSSSN